MHTSLRGSYSVCLFLGGLIGTAPGEPRLFLVRQGEDPSKHAPGPFEVTVNGGETITFEMFLESSEPVFLKAVAGTFPRTAVCGDSASGTVFFESGLVDTSRPDYLFDTSSTIHVGVSRDFVTLLARGVDPQVVTLTPPKYCGEITYRASPDACGTFFIDFVDPGADESSLTYLAVTWANLLPFTTTEQAVMSVRRDGDVNFDGVVDIL